MLLEETLMAAIQTQRAVSGYLKKIKHFSKCAF